MKVYSGVYYLNQIYYQTIKCVPTRFVNVIEDEQLSTASAAETETKAFRTGETSRSIGLFVTLQIPFNEN